MPVDFIPISELNKVKFYVLDEEEIQVQILSSGTIDVIEEI